VEPIHSKLACTALGMTVRNVADAIDVNANTVARFEIGKTDAKQSTVEKLKDLYENQGIILIYEDENGGPGVRLRK
jgi:predicted transcriptional regulator